MKFQNFVIIQIRLILYNGKTKDLSKENFTNTITIVVYNIE